MADLRKVGVEFVVIGQNEFDQAMIQASAQVNFFSETVQKGTDSIVTFGRGWEQAFNSLRQVGATPLQAIQQLNDAVAQGLSPQQVMNRALQDRFNIVQNLALQGKDWNQIQKEMNDLADKNANTHARLSESAIMTSRAFFALTLASFGLMTIQKDLKQAFGDELPQAFDKAISGLQIIASFGSAGAFSGIPGGAVIGGFTGAVLALADAALQVDPAIQQLNQSLDSMAKKDENIEQLAKVLGVTKEQAQKLNDAAKLNPEFAAQLRDVAKAAEPVPPLLDAVTTAMDKLGIKTDDVLGKIGEQLNKGLGEVTRYAVVIGEIAKKLTAGEELDLTSPGALTNQLVGGLLQGRLGMEELQDAMNQGQEAVDEYTKKLGTAGAEAGKLNDLNTEANRILSQGAMEKYADALANAAQRMSELNQRTQNQIDSARQQYANTVQDAGEARANAIFNAEQNLTDRIADLWTSLQDRVSDINENLANRIADIQSNLANRIADIQQNLQDRIGQIQLQLQNKLDDLAHQRAEQNTRVNNEIAKAAQDLSNRLLEIERTRIEAIEALDFNTAEQLRSAKTDHDRDAIMRRRQFELAQINQRANDERDDAQRSFAERMEQFRKERQAAEDNYNYQVMLARRLAQQQIAEAQRAAEQQRVAAERQAAQQIAVAQREAAQQEEIARRRYNEELAQAQRTYAEQVAAANRAEQQKLADAARSLQQRLDAIQKAHELERQAIELTRQKAIDALNEILSKMGAVTAAWQAMLAQFGAAGRVTGNLFSGWMDQWQNSGLIPQPQVPNVGGASGLDMIVPAGYPSDTYHIGASTGERVTITPANTTNHQSRSMTINMPIYDATDPQKVARVVKKVFDDAAYGLR